MEILEGMNYEYKSDQLLVKKQATPDGTNAGWLAGAEYVHYDIQLSARNLVGSGSMYILHRIPYLSHLTGLYKVTVRFYIWSSSSSSLLFRGLLARFECYKRRTYIL